MCGIKAIGAQGCGYMFTFFHDPLKIAILLHKMADECKQPLVAVCTLLGKISGLSLVSFFHFKPCDLKTAKI